MELQTMGSEDNKAVVLHFVEEVQGKHRLDLVADMLHPDYIDHAQPGGLPPAPGVTDAREAFKRFFRVMLQAFPDLDVTIEDQIAEGDKVVTRKTFRGTHRGELWGQPATGKRVSLEVIDIFRVQEGKIIEHWAELDLLALSRQLGLRFPG
jgi:steroid delta-isomerase-like uncharacterized protein